MRTIRSVLNSDYPHLRIIVIPRILAAMAYLVIFASLIAFSAYVYLLQHEPTGRVASYAYVNPIIALVVGAWFAGESLSGRQYMACLAIIVGVAVTLFGKQSAQPRIVLAARSQ